MDLTQLIKGKKIQDEASELRRVVEHFSKFDQENQKDDPIEFLINYLTKCNNLGSGKKELSRHLISYCLDTFKDRLEAVNVEFNEL